MYKNEETHDRLTTQDDWRSAWGESKPLLNFDPGKPFFLDLHKLLQRTLPVNKEFRCLEIGCYPGTYLWYFNKYFQYQVSGIEYVEELAHRSRDHLRQLGIDADIHQADIFDFSPGEKWDVVFSVGLIEHFLNTEDIINQHLKLLKPGGYLVLIIPHHSGLNGKILKAVDPKIYKIHNQMDYAAMKEGLEKTRAATIIEGGYYGHLGFWNTNLYPKLREMGQVPYFMGRCLFYSIEHIAQYIIPNMPYFAPNCALIARKMS